MAADTRIAPSVQTVPTRLVETSADVRAAVLADPAGGLIAASAELEADAAHRFAGLAGDLFAAADGALGDPAQQVEAQVEGGAVFAVRDADYTLTCVTSRPTLPSLVLYDLQQALEQIERDA